MLPRDQLNRLSARAVVEALALTQSPGKGILRAQHP